MTDTATGQVVKVYNHADKVFNLVKGLPIGAMTFGSGAIGPASISTLSKDLRIKLSNNDSNNEYYVDPDNYTVHEVAEKAKKFFSETFKREHPDGVPDFYMGYWIAGYSSIGALPEAYSLGFFNGGVFGPRELNNGSSFGLRWEGEREALDRLILGLGGRFSDAIEELGIEKEASGELTIQLVRRLAVKLWMPAMPIQDAIDLARFLAETAARFAHFDLRAPTVGGAIELATITKHEGFRWVNRKHYFPNHLNP